MYQVALHEMGHVLGIGSPLWGEMLRGKTGPDTHFPGPKAVAAFNEAGGVPYTGGKVPVDTGVSVSRNFHWRYDVIARRTHGSVGRRLY